jgi:hypothetical protein
MPFDCTPTVVITRTPEQSEELEALKRGRERIKYFWRWRKRGWIPNFVNWRRWGRICAINAISATSHGDSKKALRVRCYARLDAHLPIHTTIPAYQAPRMQIAWFNDRPATRHRDILKVFDAAIAELEAI